MVKRFVERRNGWFPLKPGTLTPLSCDGEGQRLLRCRDARALSIRRKADTWIPGSIHHVNKKLPVIEVIVYLYLHILIPEILPLPSYAKATAGSPRLHPRSKQAAGYSAKENKKAGLPCGEPASESANETDLSRLTFLLLDEGLEHLFP